jgi:hypothetical protein
MPKKAKKRQASDQRPTLIHKLGHWFRGLPAVGRGVIFAIGVPGLYVGVLSALPRTSVTAGDALLNSHFPLSFPFVVSNEGYLDVHQVNVFCAIDKLSSADAVDVIGFEVQTPSNLNIGDLGAGGRATTFCGPTAFGFKGTKFQKGHLTLVLSYRPDFLPWRQSKKHFFTGLADEEGKLHWVESSN